MEVSSENDNNFTAYCCGMPMKVIKKDNLIRFVCATGKHGRWFTISEDSSQQSLCSCHSGQGNLVTADLGAVRLYSCKQCGARYSVFVNGIKIETEIEGINADEVLKVGRESISAMWDKLYDFQGRNRSEPSLQREAKIFIYEIKGDAIFGQTKQDLSTKIDISGSAIGLLNTGEIEDIQSISTNVLQLTESGHLEISNALRRLSEAVITNDEISENQRAEYLKQINEISNQASLEPEKRTKVEQIKEMLVGLAMGLGAAGGLAEVWSLWGPAILKFFGL